MLTEKWVRNTLWISFPFNLIAAGAVLWPHSLPGQLFGIPTDAPLAVAVLLAWLIGLFGFVYAWLARQAVMNRGMLGAASVAKAGVFFIMLALWLMNEASGRMLIASFGDLALAMLWGGWLLKSNQ